MRATPIILSSAIAVSALVVTAGPARAEEQGRFLNAPLSAARPVPQLAVQLELKLRLPDGRGLARQLMDAGVDQDDAAAAAKLAAGHLGDGEGGCSARIAISRSSGEAAYKLQRLTLYTEATQTVIERREGKLAIASSGAARHSIKLV